MPAGAVLSQGGPIGRPDRRAERVASIIRMQALLFDSPFAEPGLESTGEYDALLDFRADPRQGKIERIISILRAQELLLTEGFALGGERSASAAREIPALIRYLRSLTERESTAARKATIVPHNLGSTFMAKGYGVPLFGDHRPLRFPPMGGVILLYRASDLDGTACIEAARMGSGIRVAYRGPGIALDSSAPWIECRATDPTLAPSSGSGDEVFAYRRFSLALGRVARKRSFTQRIVDPYGYEYAYLFFEGPRLNANIGRFVAELFSGPFGVPLREAERIAESFSGRLP